MERYLTVYVRYSRRGMVLSSPEVRLLADKDLAWVPRWLSRPRWDTYLRAADGDPAVALRLYEWNVDIARALMHDVAHIEIALRNHYDAVLSEALNASTHWVFKDDTPLTVPLIRRRHGKSLDLNARNRSSIDDAKRRCRNPHPAPGQVIAELNFGFWRHMTDAAHEKTLWIPILHKAYPEKSDRKDIDQIIGLINEVRNRASHHEPFITVARLEQAHQAGRQIIHLAEMIMPPLAEYIQSTSTLDAVLSMHVDRGKSS